MAQKSIGSVSAASALLAEATQIFEKVRPVTFVMDSSRRDIPDAVEESASQLNKLQTTLGVLRSASENDVKHLGPALARLEAAEQQFLHFLKAVDPQSRYNNDELSINWDRRKLMDINNELSVARVELEQRSFLFPRSTTATSSGNLADLVGNVNIGAGAAGPADTNPRPPIVPDTKSPPHPSKAIPIFPITFNGNKLSQEGARESSDYIMVQTQAPLGLPSTRTFLKELSDIGLTLLQSISWKTYLFRRKNLELEQIRQMPYIVFAGYYDYELKLAQNLKAVQDQPHRFYEVDVTFHEDVDTQSTQLRDLFTKTVNISPGSLDFDQYKVRLRVQGSYVKNIASLDQVQTIESVPEVMPRSSIARRILRAGIPLEHQNYVYEGKDQIVAVADTGFDRGNIRYTHPAFTTAGSQGGQFKNRVLALYPMSEVSSLSDFDGHGTHVCALVLGNGFMRNPDGTRTEMKGTAPKARLVVQCLGHDLNGIPSDLTNLFRLPYHNIGARIHTNSWGACWRGQQEAYNSSAREIDRFVWDHPELLICWAAGNDGETNSNPDGIQIGAEAAAKNCITIGASKSDILREHEILPDSSRGPTREGRIKPDVVAPGDSILSATSGHRMHPHYGRVPSSYDARWCYDTGTSMSTPLVAGCAAVLREALVANGTDDPSAALIKALLINGAIPLDDVIPNNQSGYGRVDLANSITTACRIGTAGFQQGGLNLTLLPEETIIIHIPDDQRGSNTLKVTLTWSDYPGEQLQNRLSLVVRATNGNGHTARQPLHQSRNNVQQIIWHHIQSEGVMITISAHTIIQPPTNPYQPYACAWQLL